MSGCKFRPKEIGSKSKVYTAYTGPLVLPLPYACVQPYHLGRYQATMNSCFGLVRLLQLGIADAFRGGVLQTVY